MPNRLDEKLAALSAKHEAERAALAAEFAVRDSLPTIPGVEPAHVFMISGVAHVSYQTGFQNVPAILAAYTLTPYHDVKDGTRSISPDAKEKYPKGKILHENIAAPVLRLETSVGGHRYSSESINFFSTIGAQRVDVKIEGVKYGERRGLPWPWRWHVRTTTKSAFGNVYEAEFSAPQLGQSWDIKWGSGSHLSAHYTLHWDTMDAFMTTLNAAIAEMEKQAAEARERKRNDYAGRRNVAEVEARARLVIDTLTPLCGDLGMAAVTLAEIRRVGYDPIFKIVREKNPEVMKQGIHDFVNTVYFLSPGTDDYENAEDYREDLRATFRTITGE